VFELVAVFAALTLGLGTFLTKGITTQIPFLTTLGPLFLLNCLFTLPIAFVQGGDWVVFEPKILVLHVSAALASVIAGYFIFVIIKRSSASISSISSTLSPAVALVLAPIWLGTSVSALQVVAVIALITASLYPIRSSIPGLRLGKTIFFTLSAAITSGFVSINVAVLGTEDINRFGDFHSKTSTCWAYLSHHFSTERLNEERFFQVNSESIANFSGINCLGLCSSRWGNYFDGFDTCNRVVVGSALRITLLQEHSR
jgi:hypothetical protein